MKFRESVGGDSKDFLKLKDGESATGVLVGDPFELKNHWTGSKSERCTQDENCEHCNAGKKPTFRFRLNFIVKEGENYVAKILEQGWKTYEALRELNVEYALEKHLIKISRKGSGLNDTVYSVIPVKDGSLSEAKLETISKVKLHDLSLTDQSQKETMPQYNSEEELPF